MSSVRTQLGSWHKMGTEASGVRVQVFVHEQAIPAELEWDEYDAASLHAVVFAHDDSTGEDLAVGTGRLIAPNCNALAESGTAKIGRMAVLKAYRREGYGGQILNALLDAALRRGYAAVELSAQLYVAAFYARYGFEPAGDQYQEVGIDHQKMVLKFIA